MWQALSLVHIQNNYQWYSWCYLDLYLLHLAVLLNLYLYLKTYQESYHLHHYIFCNDQKYHLLHLRNMNSYRLLDLIIQSNLKKFVPLQNHHNHRNQHLDLHVHLLQYQRHKLMIGFEDIQFPMMEILVKHQ